MRKQCDWCSDSIYTGDRYYTYDLYKESEDYCEELYLCSEKCRVESWPTFEQKTKYWKLERERRQEEEKLERERRQEEKKRKREAWLNSSAYSRWKFFVFVKRSLFTIMSLFIPGLGQLFTGRFFLSVVLFFGTLFIHESEPPDLLILLVHFGSAFHIWKQYDPRLPKID